MKRVHGKRAMLNLPGFESTGAIVAEISDTSDWEPDKEFDSEWELYPETTLQFSDCSRTVSMNISVDGDENIVNTLHKLDTMIEALQELRTGIRIESIRFAERKAKLAAKKEQENEPDN